MSEHKHGGDIYSNPGCLDFSSNCNPMGLPAGVRKALEHGIELVECYPRTDHGPLLSAIAEYEQVGASEVICGNGAAELIYAICFAAHAKKALLPVPSFAEYESALRSTQCEIVYYQMKEDFQIHEDFLNQLSGETDILFLTNPNNPTGLLIDDHLLKEIIRICGEKEIRVVLDECFLDFVEERDQFSMKSLLKTSPNLFILKAFTKRYAMPGVRLGYGLCGDAAFLKEIRSVIQPWNLSVFAIEAGMAALKEEQYVETGRELILKERDRLKKALKDMKVRFLDAKANYIFFFGGKDLDRKLRMENILIRNCSNYTGLSEGWYRIAVRTEAENTILIRMLRKYLVEEGE